MKNIIDNLRRRIGGAAHSFRAWQNRVGPEFVGSSLSYMILKRGIASVLLVVAGAAERHDVEIVRLRAHAGFGLAGNRHANVRRVGAAVDTAR